MDILKQSQAELKRLTEIIVKDATNARNKLVSDAANQRISPEAIELIPNAFAGASPEFDSYERERQRLEKESKETTSFTQGTNYGSVTTTVKTEGAHQAEKELEALNKLYPTLKEVYDFKLKSSDEEKKAYKDLTQEVSGYNSSLDELNRTINREENKFNKSSGSGGSNKIKPEIEIPEGSIAYIDKQISDLNKKISLSIDPEEQRKLYQQIEELRNQKISIEVQYKHSKPDDIGVNTDFSVKPSIDIEGDIAGMSD
ncbi:hypothetical protein [Proteiniphilum acetatigenes]|uniref:hypothetical protein n=1 Tax=Proteiniphilum acetatigenes TaxID=294710 RepID=UPI000379ABD9|nr:hypothetical protein [Proteiniphilum acetatigenes]